MPFSLLDSLDSDTDCLAQEKAYQLDLQKRITSNAEIVEGNIDLQTNVLDLKRENLIYDSIEVTPATVVDDHTSAADQEVTSDDSDEYADLRYDPDWRRNFEEARLFHKLRTRLSLDQSIRDSTEGSEESLGRLQGSGEIVNGIGHKVVRSGRSTEACVPVEKLSSDQADLSTSSFHLHPPAVSSPSGTSSQTQSPPASSASDGGGSNYSLKEGWLSKPQSYRHNKVIHEQHDQTCEPREQSKEASTSQFNDNKPSFGPNQKNGTHQRSKARPLKPKTDVVEQNRVTLGLNQSKQGSYLRRYGKRRDQSEPTDEVQGLAEDSSTDGRASREDERPLDSEHLWHQRTQRLKVTQVIQGERRPQPKGGNTKPPHDRTYRTQVAQTRHRLKPLLARPLAAEDNHPLAEILVLDGASSSSNTFSTPPPPSPPAARQLGQSPTQAPLPLSGRTPMVNLNINLNASSVRELSSHTGREHQQQQQGGPLTLVSPQVPQWMVHPHVYHVPLPVPDLISPPPPPPPPPPPHAAGLGQWAILMASPRAATHSDAGHQVLDLLAPPGGPSLWSLNHERVAVWQPGAGWAPEPAAQLRDPSLTSSHSTASSGPYSVLPPIGGTTAEAHAPVPAGVLNSAAALGPGCCSDGYLAQLDKQRHTKAQAGYKVYTLKDYKGLQQNVKLGGLGPSNTVNETIAEKIRRQKLYSDVIRQQNKQISRIPFLPAQAKAQDPERTNKDTAPRRKALEYARTIVKPKVSPRPKKEDGAGSQARTRYLSGEDVGHLTLLESLRLRHEQEKQAVAQFKAVHAI